MLPEDTRPRTCSSPNFLVEDDILCENKVCRLESGFYTGKISFSAVNQYHLDGPVMLGDTTGDCPAELQIEPGTAILAATGRKSRLVILPSASMIADGLVPGGNQEIKPIVFRSDTPSPQAGAWGGLEIRGKAETNCGNVTNICEGDSSLDQFGGSDNRSNSGILRYIKIEDAGQEQHAALSLKAVGLGTTVEFVHITNSAGDGLAISGGRIQLRNILLTQVAAHSFRWQFGWQGLAQFVIIQQPAEAIGSALMGSNSPLNPDANPRSEPILSHFTIIGPPTANIHSPPAPGIQFREGTGGELWNSVVTGYPLNHPAIDVDGPATFAHALAGDTNLSVAHSVFCNRTNAFSDPEEPFPSRNLLIGMPPPTKTTNSVSETCQLGLPDGITDPDVPDFIPVATSSLTQGAGDPLNVFFGTQTYIGAVEPGLSPAWYQWAYP
ncbi:MAG: hypothetical protein KTR25_03085 [Myxococcales bacterium]|nr:hypothetical protein [Myxococcales bacterium]